MIRRKSRRKSSRRLRNPMKGWAKSVPKHGRQRKSMKHKCGSKCFLRSSNNGFPVCAKGSCKYSCKGLLAAKTRARQYKYNSIAAKAQSIASKKRCSWVKSSGKQKKSRSKRR